VIADANRGETSTPFTTPVAIVKRLHCVVPCRYVDEARKSECVPGKYLSDDIMATFPDNLKPAYSGAEALDNERARSTISSQELSKHLLSRGDFLARQARIVKIIEKEPLCSKQNQANLSRPDRYHLGLARAKLLIRLRKKHDWSYEDYTMAEYLIDEMSPFFLNHTMFVTTIREQASDEQKKHWLPQIENFDILGAYAQTEMGHGSNVRGLELQARWDPNSHEFILHSPTLTASKWWNGSMGRTATHAVSDDLLARLGTQDLSRKDRSRTAAHPNGQEWRTRQRIRPWRISVSRPPHIRRADPR